MKKMRNNNFKVGSLFWASVPGKQNKGFIENSAKDFLVNDRYIK